MRRLPPFAELVAFEAVARHLSFTRASEELCVTQSAVSHRIRRLERHFGTALVQRLNPGIALTPAGAALLPQLAAALDGLAELGQRGERKLRVAAGTALCTWWLAGRLAGFMAQRPGVSVELVPVDNAQSPIPVVDVRVLWVAPGEDTPGPTQAPLFAEQVFPVCAPGLLPGGRPLADARHLGRFPLLHKAVHATGEWSWSLWLERLGAPAPARDSELRFADMGLLMSAAVNGSGVALTRSLLAHDALAQGRLMPAVRDFTPMASVKRHVARWPSAKTDDPDIRAFVGWLVAEAGQTLAATEQLLAEQALPRATQRRRA